jgi:hypothetical protein
MRRALLLTFAMTVIAPHHPAAQTAPQPAAPAAVQPGGPKPKPMPITPPEPGAQEPPAPAPGPTPPRTAPQLANVRLDLTITDQRGSTPAVGKTVSMLVADRFNGRVRTGGHAKVGTSFQPVTLNVDAQPEILRDGRVRVQVSLEYRAQNPDGGPPDDAQPSTLSEQFSVILEDGKSMVVTQSADPASDRKVRVELKASLVK